ncbi:substrate-binding periplasmic protein [Janthinobacterium fluminis]|uniref:Transporter substrate-binding domain-containing protein n=1 Tax=Janthinobacterium fluminis TaxID=2987524 RepID=A0ABT5K4B0_9BURK|nr:transporter substrate-binding domain-containing protein [Janthinobacterium fluminis]MDC8759798.1 transporter substrate-binding domain-containing protein [Janthinobacterium fluminis]
MSICLGALALLGAAPAARATELRILTEENPPISFSEQGKAAGLGVDLVDDIQRRLKSHQAVQVLPWARAYAMLQQEPNIALFATMRTAEREAQFKWVGPIATVKTSFYARRGDGVHLANLAEAKAAGVILVPREYYSHQVLNHLGFVNLQAVSRPDIMVRMLMAGRRGLMVGDNLTIAALLQNVGAKAGDAEPVYTFMESQYYIAFSRQSADALVQQWQASLDEMKRDGRFAAIYAKWLPGETPPGLRPNAPAEPGAAGK